MSKKLIFKLTVWKEGKYYVAQCLNVDVSSFGNTKIEAINNLKEALDLYFEDAKTVKVLKIEKPSIESLSFTHA